MNGVSLVRAQETNTPGITNRSASDGTTSLSTNAPASTLLDNHPSAAPVIPSEQPDLSLRPPPVPEGGISGPTPSSPGASTETFNLIGRADEVEDLANHLLVVYNQNDSDSKLLAEYYAAKRNIPAERVFPISCSNEEEITRADYEKTIRQPSLYLLQKKLDGTSA